MQIGSLTCPGTMPGSPVRRKDACEHDHQVGAIRSALEAELIEPYLYPRHGPDPGPMLAEAIAKRIGTK